jgi:hypothetical protein
MESRERNNEGMPGGPGGGAADDAGDLDRRRADGERFLAAGDAAIRRALSGDSEAFLRANRQRGGE